MVKPVRILGGTLAAGGGFALAIAMTAMKRIGDCGNGYDPPCPVCIEISRRLGIPWSRGTGPTPLTGHRR
ncbi:MAG: hypothetical protein QOI25_4575 [Mycobacterium sp.]|nr:hypothetical protein [Mycobacterium sp.]